MKIRFIDIQFHNVCNRKCWFCPPHTINKVNEYKEMSENTLNRVVGFINYICSNNMIDGKLAMCTNRYNEPFCRTDLYIKNLNILYNSLQKQTVALACNTNGDFLTSHILENIINMLHHITISLYDKNTIESLEYVYKIFDKAYIKNFFIDKVSKEIRFVYKEKEVFVKINRGYNTDNFVRSRGSILDIGSPIRTEECSVIGKMIAINYDGTISPCCDLYQGNVEHKDVFPYININDFNNEDFINKIDIIFNDFKKRSLHNKTCKNCTSTEYNSMGEHLK